jgi:hypothetical protein
MRAARSEQAMPPLTGYNNNVRHRGRVFHIQTEDSGASAPRIVTHLFADGGRIVKSTRTDYSEHVGTAEMVDTVRGLMKDQHKAMFVALRSGALDETIGFDDDAPPPTLAATQISSEVADVMLSQAPADSAPSAERPSAPEAADIKTSSAPASSSGARDEADRAYAAPRPAAIFSSPPSGQSIFGAVGLDERSLDDAILSYLAEESPKEKR